MTAEQKISKAKTGMILTAPFFAMLAMRLKYVEDNSQPTMYTDGLVIGYNKEFVERMTIDEVKGVLVHEVFHVLGLHPMRLGERIPIIANMAMDYAINPLVKDAQYTLPKDVLFDNKFKNMEFEAIYPHLMKQFKDKLGGGGLGKGADGDQQGDGQGFKGDVGGVRRPKNEDGSAMSSGEIKQLEEDWKQSIQNAYQTAKKQGHLPAGIDRIVKEMAQPIVNWKDVMQEFVVQNSRNDYCWTKPNKRFIDTGFILPSLEKPELGDIVVAIDTSGSMGPKELSEIAGELQSLLQTFSCKFIVVYCDTKVYPPEKGGVVEFQGDDLVELKMVGGGGTDFRPPFHYVEKEGIEPVGFIYFTDGYCYDFPKKSPEYKCLWVITGTKSYYRTDFAPPFGEVVKMVRED
jgi:predicted metal-dependent peptidase